MRYSFVHWAALLTAVRNSPCSCPFSASLHPPLAALNSEPRQWGLMWEFVLYQNAPRPGSWQAEGLTEGEQLAALGSSDLFPFRLLITFAATTLVGIWSSCFAAACNTPYSARFSPRCIAHWARSARIPRFTVAPFGAVQTRRTVPYPFAERSFQWGYGGCRGA